MRIIMMGTGGYAVPTFEALLDSDHEVVSLITKPPAGRKRKSAPVNPMRAAAEARGLTIHDPESINSPEGHEILRAAGAELFVVCDYGQILSPETLALSTHGGINLHASLLPKYRGAAPINWALFNGDAETGNTVLHMTPKIDAGPCVAQDIVTIELDEDAIALEERLAARGAPLVLETIAAIAAGRLEAIVQDKALVTRAPRLKKSDGEIDWSRTAGQILDQMRALKPWPGTFSHWHREGKEPLRLTIPAAQLADGIATAGTAGTIIESGDRLVIATAEGALELPQLQPAGKRVLSAAEFLRGYPVAVGQRFGPT